MVFAAGFPVSCRKFSAGAHTWENVAWTAARGRLALGPLGLRHGEQEACPWCPEEDMDLAGDGRMPLICGDWVA